MWPIASSAKHQFFITPMNAPRTPLVDNSNALGPLRILPQGARTPSAKPTFTPSYPPLVINADIRWAYLIQDGH
jgi:hypothetical protein